MADAADRPASRCRRRRSSPPSRFRSAPAGPAPHRAPHARRARRRRWSRRPACPARRSSRLPSTSLTTSDADGEGVIQAAAAALTASTRKVRRAPVLQRSAQDKGVVTRRHRSVLDGIHAPLKFRSSVEVSVLRKRRSLARSLSVPDRRQARASSHAHLAIRLAIPRRSSPVARSPRRCGCGAIGVACRESATASNIMPPRVVYRLSKGEKKSCHTAYSCQRCGAVGAASRHERGCSACAIPAKAGRRR